MSIIKIKRLTEAARLPEYATEGAACFDLRAIEPGHVEAFGAHTFRTGLAFEIPRGSVMLIYSRSGHGFKNDIRLANCVGVIDSDYRGEVMVKLRNDGPIAFDFEAGDRIAQAMIAAAPAFELEETSKLSDTARGAGGFGSTGQ